MNIVQRATITKMQLVRMWRFAKNAQKRHKKRLSRQGAITIICLFACAVCGGIYGISSAVSTDKKSTDAPKQQLYQLREAPPFTIALDPGHGGFDTGAKGIIDEILVCETTVDYLFEMLEKDENYTPLRVRQNGEDLSSNDRAQAAIDNKADVYLSVHANCDREHESTRGFECFPTPPGRIYSDESLRFAQYIINEMALAGHKIRKTNGVAYAYYNGKSKKIVDGSDTKVRTQKSFGVVEKPLCPSVLVEQCFLTNYEDVKSWGKPEGCKKAAEVYYRAICEYFGTKPLI